MMHDASSHMKNPETPVAKHCQRQHIYIVVMIMRHWQEGSSNIY